MPTYLAVVDGVMFGGSREMIQPLLAEAAESMKRAEYSCRRHHTHKSKKDEKSKQSLVAQLTRINSHLETKGGRFLTGDTMCCFDCELMPKLQHIRIAGKNFADFEIPTSLKALWK